MSGTCIVHLIIHGLLKPVRFSLNTLIVVESFSIGAANLMLPLFIYKFSSKTVCGIDINQKVESLERSTWPYVNSKGC